MVDGGTIPGRGDAVALVGLPIEVMLEVEEVDECFARTGTVDLRGVGRPEEVRSKAIAGGRAILAGVALVRGLEVKTSLDGLAFTLAFAGIGGLRRPSDPRLESTEDRDEVAEDMDSLEVLIDEGRAGENESNERSKDSSSEEE